MHQLTNLFIISEISYTLHLRVETGVLRCHGLMMRREGVEFAMRSSTDTTWIPLQLTYFSDSDSTVTEVIRGHSVMVTGSTSADVPRQVFVYAVISWEQVISSSDGWVLLISLAEKPMHMLTCGLYPACLQIWSMTMVQFPCLRIRLAVLFWSKLKTWWLFN